jgi:diguanylate cyclase (GGDEF)-like protein/PAS domain S-box-containing protein
MCDALSYPFEDHPPSEDTSTHLLTEKQPPKDVVADILGHPELAISSFWIDSDHHITYRYFSPGCQRLYGYSPQELRHNPGIWLDRIHVQDREEMIAAITTQGTTSQAFTVAYRYDYPGEERRWIEGRYIAHPEPQQRRWAVTGVHQDISDRKQTEEALKNRNQELYGILEAFPDLLFRVYQDGTILEYQTAQQQDLYVAPVQFLNRSIADFLPPGVADRLQHSIQDTLHSGQLNILEYELTFAKGAQHFEGRVVRLGADEVLVIARNITHRKTLEAELRASQKKYETLFNILPVGITITDPEGQILEVNPIATHLLADVAAGPDDPVLDPACVLIQPDGTPLPPEATPAMQSLRDNRTILDVEAGVRCPEGLHGWLNITATPIPLADYGVAVVYSDITARKQVAQALALSEQRLRTVLDQMPLIAVMLDREGRILLANEKLLRLTQWTREAVLGQSWFTQFVPSDLQETLREVFEAALRNDRWPREYENEIVTRQGDRRLITWKNLVFYDREGQFQWVTSLGEDITERRQRELALQSNEERLRMALEGANMGSWDWNLQTGQVIWSASLERLMGFAPGSFDQRIETVLGLMHPGDRDRLSAAIQTSIDTDRPYDIEFRFHRQDGTLRWAASKGRVLRDPDGTPLRFVGIDVDITDRKQAEAERDRLFNLAADGLCITDAQGYFRHVNPAFCAMLGYGAADLRDRPCQDFVYPEDLAATQLAVAQLRQGHTLSQFENRYIRRDGRLCWLSWTVVPYLNEGLAYCSVRDVTQSKQAAETLYQYKRMVAAAPDGMALVSPDYVYQVVNQVYCDRFQRDLQDIEGRPVAALLGQATFEANARPYLDRALAGQVVTFQDWFETSHHRRYFLGVTFAPYYNSAGDITGVVVTSRDLTDLKRAEITLQKQAAREMILTRLTSTLQETFEIATVLNSATGIIRDYFDADRALVYQLQTDGSGQVVAEDCQFPWPSMAGVTLDDACLAEPSRIQAYQAGKVQNIPDVSQASLHVCYLDMLRSHQVQANLVVPILQDHTLWGLLGIQQCDRPRLWEADDIDMLHQLSQKLSIAIRQAELYENLQATNHKLEYLANHDALTRLPNRRHFIDTLTLEWQRAIRHGTPLTLILCDVDYFKRYNDTYGHIGGDKCLAKVATTLQQAIRRPADMVARYGGEEFIIVLPQTTGVGAVKVVEAIQASLRQVNIPHRMSLVSDRVTLSFGIACQRPQKMDRARSLLQQADDALYEAKQNGRNRYFVPPHSLETPTPEVR